MTCIPYLPDQSWSMRNPNAPPERDINLITLEAMSRTTVAKGYPLVVIFEGPPGSGKRFFAEELAERLGLQFTSSDLPFSAGPLSNCVKLSLRPELQDEERNCLWYLDEADVSSSTKQLYGIDSFFLLEAVGYCAITPTSESHIEILVIGVSDKTKLPKHGTGIGPFVVTFPQGEQ